MQEITVVVSGSPRAAAAAAGGGGGGAGCGQHSAALGRLLLTQLRAVEPTITYNRCCLDAVTTVDVVVVVEAVQ